MKSIVSVTITVLVVAIAMSMAPQSSRSQGADPASTYEHLATAIIAIRETENSLVHDILADYLAAACANLERAAQAEGTDRRRWLEAAAGEITNFANEGDKRIQAVRQRLLKAGHHHHTDSETQDDYMFVDSKEKTALLAIAGKVARMSQASAAEIRSTSEQVTALAETALKSE